MKDDVQVIRLTNKSKKNVTINVTVKHCIVKCGKCSKNLLKQKVEREVSGVQTENKVGNGEGLVSVV